MIDVLGGSTGPQTTGQVRPLLRWAGSKRAILGTLNSLVVPEYKKYIEPFAGSACLFFSLGPSKAVIADLNAELIDTYRTIREFPRDVSRRLEALPFGRDHYYDIRAIDPKKLPPVERAARFIYLNRFCFNGLYRTNLAGRFNVPFGAPRNASVPSVEHLEQCAEALRRADLQSGDFDLIVRSSLEANDFVYLDPPFFQTEGRMFREYTSKPFMSDDLSRLSSLLDFIDQSGATFVLSYAASNEATKLAARWHQVTVPIQRNIAGFAGARGKTTEVVVSNRSLNLA